jgi:predicted TIM-barrel fold metal-dependent hydrolase
MRAAGSRSVWLAPGSQTLWPWLYEDILGTCAKRKIPTFLHRDLVTPDHIVKVCEAHPRLRLVLVGVGYGDDWWLYPLMRHFPNVAVCLGHFYIPSYGPMRFLEHFPADRLLFGSGLPGFSPGGLIAHVMYADIGDRAREKIMSRNLLRLIEEADV